MGRIPRVTQTGIERFANVLGAFAKEVRHPVARDLNVETVDVIPTGMPPLDHALVCGGLPRGTTIEFYGNSSSGKCVTGATLVPVVGQGLLRIDEVGVALGVGAGAEQEARVPCNHVVWSDAGPVESAALYYAGYQPTYDVRTEYGHDLSGVDGHRVLTLGLPEDAADDPASPRWGLARWSTLRGLRPGDVVFQTFATPCPGDGVIELPQNLLLPRRVDTEAGAALLGALAGVDPRTDSWALVAGSQRGRDLFRGWVGELGILPLTREVPEWTEVTGMVPLVPEATPLVALAVTPEVLRGVRRARASLQVAWLRGLILTKGVWRGPYLEVEVFSGEVARTLQGLSESLGVRWIRYETLSEHGEPRWKLALRGRLDQQTATEVLWPGDQAPRGWGKRCGREEDELHPRAAHTLRIARDLLARRGHPEWARQVDPEDLSREQAAQVHAWVAPLVRGEWEDALSQTLGVLASPCVSWDRVTETSRGVYQPCWDYWVPVGSRLATGGLLSHNSTLAGWAARQDLEHNPQGLVLYMDFEHSMTPKYVRLMGLKSHWQAGRFHLLDQIRTSNEAENLLDALVNPKVGVIPSLVIIDSLAAMQSEGGHPRRGRGDRQECPGQLPPGTEVDRHGGHVRDHIHYNQPGPIPDPDQPV
jgi:RecA/RadA recombinase